MIITDKNRHAYMILTILCALAMIFMWWVYAVSIAPPLLIFMVLAWVYGIVAAVLAWPIGFWVIRWFVWNTDCNPGIPMVIVSLLWFASVLIVAFLLTVTF